MVLVATQVKRRRGTTAENDAFTGAEGEITVDTEKHELRVHDGVTQGGFKIGGGSGAMPVGAIFTTPRTGTIQGAVEANGSPYNIADYSGEGSIGALLTAGSIAYVSKAEFQTQVTNTGACDSFGWDGASDTTFLVPKLNPWHVGKNAPVVGNGKALGLTDGTNSAGLQRGSVTTTSNCLSASATGYGVDIGTANDNRSGLSNNTLIGVTTESTKSGMIADLSETTNLRVMVQLATGATDQALETCTSVLADVAGLKDMSNVTATGKETVVGWGMPDYSAGIAVNLSVNVIWTAPSDGILILSSKGGTNPAYYGLINETIVFNTSAGQTAGGQGGLIILNKNDTVKMTTLTVATQHNTFVPLKGVN